MCTCEERVVPVDMRSMSPLEGAIQNTCRAKTTWFKDKEVVAIVARDEFRSSMNAVYDIADNDQRGLSLCNQVGLRSQRARDGRGLYCVQQEVGIGRRMKFENFFTNVRNSLIVNLVENKTLQLDTNGPESACRLLSDYPLPHSGCNTCVNTPHDSDGTREKERTACETNRIRSEERQTTQICVKTSEAD